MEYYTSKLVINPAKIIDELSGKNYITEKVICSAIDLFNMYNEIFDHIYILKIALENIIKTHNHEQDKLPQQFQAYMVCSDKVRNLLKSTNEKSYNIVMEKYNWHNFVKLAGYCVHYRKSSTPMICDKNHIKFAVEYEQNLTHLRDSLDGLVTEVITTKLSEEYSNSIDIDELYIHVFGYNNDGEIYNWIESLGKEMVFLVLDYIEIVKNTFMDFIISHDKIYELDCDNYTVTYIPLYSEYLQRVPNLSTLDDNI